MGRVKFEPPPAKVFIPPAMSPRNASKASRTGPYSMAIPHGAAALEK
jgi:hypothetical protein